MASLLPFKQQFIDLKGTTLGYHELTLQSTSDTFTVPTLANTNSNASSAQVRQASEAAVTVTDDGANTVTLVGTAGNNVTVVTLHGPALVNYGAEA